MNNKCVFIDKDGTLIHDVPYNVNTDLILFYDDIFEPLQNLQDEGYKIIIISNQSGIEKGLFTESELNNAFNHIIQQLKNKGIEILDYAYCPHDTDNYLNPTCQCRKPQPKMILDMALKHQINLKESWMIGDIIADIAAGNRAGCRTILIDRHATEEAKLSKETPAIERPTISIRDFKHVDDLILSTHKQLTWNEIL